MDTISYGIANKTKDAESNLRNQTLSAGVEGKFMNVKERIDSLEKYLEGLSLRANKLIVHDAVNIMKAHAKLNSIAKTIKYNMQNMMFDDLLDLSGIDKEKSEGYIHSPEKGSLITAEECVIETTTEELENIPSKLILIANVKVKPVSSDENLIPKMTSNTTPSGEAFASNINQGEERHTSAYEVFDRNVDSRWGANYVYGTTPIWVGYNFTESTVINKYTIKGGASFDSHHPVRWKFQGSINGQEYSDLHLVEGAKFNEMEKKEYIFENRIAFKYYRLLITETSKEYTLPNIAEIEMMGSEVSEITKNINYYISRDNGETWINISPEELFRFDDKAHPKGKQLKLKIELPANVELENYSLTWA
ncbi:discoidin domain-containing protein [Bacillus thuringiensis]|uniref:discoidin domain-containing protein n=1 Tax=Bacillus thuringiensis TaxID=1428 RepID=UPI0036709D80